MGVAIRPDDRFRHTFGLTGLPRRGSEDPAEGLAAVCDLRRHLDRAPDRARRERAARRLVVEPGRRGARRHAARPRTAATRASCASASTRCATTADASGALVVTGAARLAMHLARQEADALRTRWSAPSTCCSGCCALEARARARRRCTTPASTLADGARRGRRPARRGRRPTSRASGRDAAAAVAGSAARRSSARCTRPLAAATTGCKPEHVLAAILPTRVRRGAHARAARRRRRRCSPPRLAALADDRGRARAGRRARPRSPRSRAAAAGRSARCAASGAAPPASMSSVSVEQDPDLGPVVEVVGDDAERVGVEDRAAARRR